ncbi:serine hydrolase domain-containing protein [Pseudoalteromonas fenneropenaei]|uniref:Serine hydrolase domain-containing protein n=1 Tax=Pseudoalteromonas fenneropenaei TaxID=1737459 RepID=A0ABV7CQC0_9GAMM
MRTPNKWVLLLGLFVFNLQARSSNFDTLLKCSNSSGAPGMAVRIEQSNSLVYTGAIGLADLNSKRKLQTDDIFQIGSVTKIFTAAAILKLSEQGTLSLQDKLGKFIPSINPDYKSLTIERVLSHTSGLPDYLDDPTVTAVYDESASIDKVIDTISNRNLISKSGEKYSYSNLGYVILGKIIEVASGVSYHEYLDRAFFKPLNMQNTFVMTKGTELDQVKGYTNSSHSPNTYIKPEYSTERKWHVDRSWIAAAGAVASTLEDMALWQTALKSGKVISKDNYLLMHKQAILDNRDKVKYGYGVDIYPVSGLVSYGHQGMVPGFFAWHVYFPTADLTATAFTNIDTKHPGPVLLNMIALQLGLSPKPVKHEEALGLANSLIGHYQATNDKVLNIFSEKGTLYAQYSGEEKQKIVLRGGNAFSYECTENYFQLRESNNSKYIVPVYLYQGEQAPMKKI